MSFSRFVAVTGMAISLAGCDSAGPDLLWKSREFSIYPERIQQGKFEAVAVSPTEISSNYAASRPGDSADLSSSWKLSTSIDAFPQYQSAELIANALYNLSLEEMQRAIESDSTFRTGKEWAGVWTRDISYSIILSMASLQPQVARKSLLRKVNAAKRIIQDTGTGGAWPVSTDRMVWVLAAWELYLVTGDQEWLQQAYAIGKNSADDDRKNIYDMETGLVKGESSFLDWREQTYPAWMQPADIYESICLSTNAVHCASNQVLARMATLVGDTASALTYQAIAAQISRSINDRLWLPEKNIYGQFLYGRINKILSPRFEALGGALCVLYGIADETRSRSVISNAPFTPYGLPCIYPQIPGIPPYHNDAVWPFVQSFWALAAARTGNETAVMESIAGIYRASAMFLTNKENFVAEDGDPAGTQVNSSNMLWSLSGNIALVHKLLFGIQYSEAGLSFKPFVPEALGGVRTLQNFSYRNAVLDIKMEGFGDSVASFSLDGKELPSKLIPPTLNGKHVIHVVMSGSFGGPSGINIADNLFSPATPQLKINEDILYWDEVAGASKYKVLKNGEVLTEQLTLKLPVPMTGLSSYQVVAVGDRSMESFASEPIEVIEPARITVLEIEKFARPSTVKYANYTGKGYTETTIDRQTVINIPVKIDSPGIYLIDFRYANGNGPVNTGNKCAIRTLKVNDVSLGAVVFPQRGNGDWANWGYSNRHQVQLKKGVNIISLLLLPENQNMHGTINAALLDHLRLIRR